MSKTEIYETKPRRVQSILWDGSRESAEAIFELGGDYISSSDLFMPNKQQHIDLCVQERVVVVMRGLTPINLLTGLYLLKYPDGTVGICTQETLDEGFTKIPKEG